MQSYGHFSQIFTQLSQAFSSVESKTQSLVLLDANYMSQEEFMLKLKQLSSEIPLLQTILKYNNIFTLFPQPGMILIFQDQCYDGDKILKEIGVGANAKVFVCNDLLKKNNYAVKIMKNNINMLEFYIQECINQYNLIQLNKEYFVNFNGLVYINIDNSYASIYMPLELAEYSLFEYIQNNEITQEIYLYFYNLLIDMLILLHSNNYAHRDIKPQNILYIMGQGWKLSDFGESIQYEQRQGLYKIQGTMAFLPQEIRQQMNKSKNKEIHQDLFKNDIYAVICTLVMIKNPKFKSKDLINYMEAQNFDESLQKLYYLNSENVDQLPSIKVVKQKMNMELFQPKQKNDNLYQYTYDITEKELLLNYQMGTVMEEDDISIIDDKLKRLKQDNQLDQYKKLQLYLMTLYPFQVHQLYNFDRKLLNHQQIFQKNNFFLDDSLFKLQYLRISMLDVYLQSQYVLEMIKQKNQFLILEIISDLIRFGQIKTAEELLQIIGKIMINDTYFNSDLFVIYNMFYFKIHGEALSIDENHIQKNIPIMIQEDMSQVKNQFNLQQYLGKIKQLQRDKIDLIILLQPLFPKIQLDQQTLNVVFSHIMEILNKNEHIIEDQFKLANVFKEQLINGGFQKYNNFMNEIIMGIVRFLLHYDLFEGLLDLLHYFLQFMKFFNIITYLQVVQVIQNLVIKLNIPIYHITDNIDIQQQVKLKQHKSYYYKKFYIFILIEQNKLLFNMIQDQQKTEESKFNLDSKQNIKKLLSNIKIKQNSATYENHLFQSIKQYAQFLGYVQSKNYKYLSFLVFISKIIYGEGTYQNYFTFEINKETVKFKFDPILLQYYILCKQDNRINELFNQWKSYENLKPLKNAIFKPLAEIILLKQNKLNRIKTNFNFLYLYQLSRFVVNQKYRQFFNFKQHLFAANCSSIQKRLKVHNICLKEQYLLI